MTDLSHVLCAVDINDDGRRVFSRALAVARSYGARLSILHAASPEVSFNRNATERVDFLRQLRSLAEAAGVEVRVDVQRGYVVEIILLHARARRPGLIVVGMSGTERRRGLSGWIAEQVLRDAPCPTLIVPKNSTTSAATFDSILCAVDFSPASLRAVDEALRLASGGRGVTLLHVIAGPDNGQKRQYAWIAPHEYYRHQRELALDKLRLLVPPHQRSRVTTQVAVGRPAEELLRATRAFAAPLLVIGVGSRNRIGHRFFAKTGALLRDAVCPILAVPGIGVAAEGIDREERAAA